MSVYGIAVVCAIKPEAGSIVSKRDWVVSNSVPYQHLLQLKDKLANVKMPHDNTKDVHAYTGGPIPDRA